MAGLTGRRGWGYKGLTPLMGVLVLLVLLSSAGSAPVYAQLPWASYRDVARNTAWGDVGTPYDATYPVAYMAGTGYDKNLSYDVGYYDADGILRLADSNLKSTGSGVLKSQIDLSGGNWAVGIWHSQVFDNSQGTPPASYSAYPTPTGIVAEDDFWVDASIPEFPTVLSAIGVAAISFAIYYWMRKRRLAGVPG